MNLVPENTPTAPPMGEDDMSRALRDCLPEFREQLASAFEWYKEEHTGMRPPSADDAMRGYLIHEKKDPSASQTH
jgi:hypothetical protein